MATVPRAEGPGVMPSAAPVRLDAPASAFGANVAAQGLADFGKVSGEVSDRFARHAEAMQAIDNKAAVDGATVTLAQRLGQIDESFRNDNKGIAAHNNLPAAFKSIEDTRAEVGSALTSPAAKAAFNTASRIATLQTTQRLASFASTEKKDYNVKQTDAVAQLAQQSATAENFDAQMDIVAQQLAVLSTPQMQGWSPEEYQLELAKRRGSTAFNVTAGLAQTHPTEAQAFFDAHAADMNPQQRTQAQQVIRASTENLTVAGIADEYTARAAGDGSATGSRAARNNNPLNLTNLGSGQWEGQVGTDGRFAKFATPEAGFAAADRNLQAYAKRGINTLSGIINRWAPPSDHNDTAAYIATISRATGIAPDAKVNLTDPENRHRILREMAKVEGGGTAAAASHSDRLDAMESNAEAGYAAIAADPRLHGDPILINRAQSQFLTNINQARALDNLATGAAKERLQSAALSANLTDPAALQSAYPGALKDWTSLNASAQRVLTNQLTAAGNAPTVVRDSNFLEIRGGLVNPATSAQFAHRDLSGVDLTRGQYQSLAKMQQDVLAKAAKSNAIQASMGRALGNEFVKQGIAAAHLRPDTPEYNHFTGALYAEMEDWLAAHPGKKPTDQEIGSLAAGVLAKRSVPARYTLGPLTFGHTTMDVAGYEVPEAEAAALTTQFTSRYGRAPTPEEVAYFYRKAR